jgi:hypothetical protein
LLQDQLERSRSTQRGLEDSLQKLEVQKRVLQVGQRGGGGEVRGQGVQVQASAGSE